MDPYQNQRDPRNHLNPRGNPANLRDGTSGAPGSDPTPDHPDGDAPDSGNPQAAGRQPQYSSGFTVIPPNESRRSKIRMIAQKGEEDLQRWKEANRPPPLNLNPERLGGNATLAGAREKQLADFRCSKLQKKLKKEELDKMRRQEEEEQLQKMKAEQREKAERLEERRRQEEQRRREQFRQDQSRVTESFLQRFERTAPGPPASCSAARTSSGSEQREKASKSVREMQLEHKRVNSAFLDKLEGQGRGSERGEGVEEAEYPFLASEDFRHWTSNTPGQQLPQTPPNPDPEQSCFDWTEEADPDWALMKLMSSFPDCCRAFLEDILDQCNGDYEQAYSLLISTLS